MHVRLVANPRARRGARLVAVARAALQAAGLEFLEENDVRRPDAIVVIGGDGSIAREIPLAIAMGIPLGVVPSGTFNELARTLRIPFDVHAASGVIAAGVTRSIDVARVNGAYYTSEASIGVSSRITRLQHSGEKQRLGWGAIVTSILLGLRYVRPFHATIECDGDSESLRAIQITVANSNRFGGIIDVRDAAIDDGLLDCYAIEAGGIFPIVSFVAAIARHGAGGLRGLRAYRGRAVRIETQRPHRIAADGEPAGTTSALFEVLRRALKIFVPGS